MNPFASNLRLEVGSTTIQISTIEIPYEIYKDYILESNIHFQKKNTYVGLKYVYKPYLFS